MTAIDSTKADLDMAAPNLRRPWGTWALGALILFLAVTPFILVIVISFGQKIEGAGWEWDFTLANYRRFFVGALWPDEVTFLHLQRLYYALYYAVIASVLAVATAFPFTYLLTRQSRRAQSCWLVFILASLSLSEVFIVMGWDVLLSNRSGLPMLFEVSGATDWLKRTGWFDVLREWGLANPRNVKFKTSEFATILTMSYLVWPYAVILLYPALSRLDPSLTEAARTMGAGPTRVMTSVILPTVKLPLIGSTLLLFVFLLGSYVTVVVFAEPAKQTTAVAVYESVRGATLDAPFGAAQAVVLLVTAALFLVLAQYLTKKFGGPLMRRTMGHIFMALSGLVLALPIIVVAGASLNGGRTMLFPPEDPNFARFVEFFITETIWVRALQNSLIVAFGSATLAVLLAWPLAYLLWAKGSNASKVLAGLGSLPFALPPIVFGVGLGFLWAFIGSLGAIWVGIVSHATLFLALPLVTISIGLQSIDRAHLDAAATMGATEAVTFRTVILPQTLPYSISGFFFALVLSFNEFIVMFFVSASAYATVTLQIFNSLRNGYTPTMAVAAVLFITVSIAVFSAVARWGDLPRLMGADQSRK